MCLCVSTLSTLGTLFSVFQLVRYKTISSPAGVVAKYCNEYVCVCVCVCVSLSLSVGQCRSASISSTPHARSLPNFFVCVVYRRGSVVLWRVRNSQGEGAIFWVFFIDNALYSIAYGTHTKTAESIEMPFGLMTWVDLGTMY